MGRARWPRLPSPRRVLLFVACAIPTGGAAADTGTHRSADVAKLWSAFDRATTCVDARGVVVLRTAPRGRIRIPGGTFTMGSSDVEMRKALELCEREIRGSECRDEDVVAMVHAEGSPHRVTLSTFALDRTEVTVGDYARCVSAGVCAAPELPTDGSRVESSFPVTHVRWEDASVFCHWADGRLPTEAEWEYAARGAEGRRFPWGDLYNAHLSNHGAWADDRTDATDGFAGVAPVGSFEDGATPLGLLDMAGNVAEWVSDTFEIDADGRPAGYPEGAQTNPPPRTGGPLHVVRGGSFTDAPMWLRSAARDTTSLPRPAWIGFRCAADER